MKTILLTFFSLSLISAVMADEYKSPVIKVNNYQYKNAEMKQDRMEKDFNYKVQENPDQVRDVASEGPDNDDDLDSRGPSSSYKDKEKKEKPVYSPKPWHFDR